jgi:putative ABC transport system ATP-binding protein
VNVPSPNGRVRDVDGPPGDAAEAPAAVSLRGVRKVHGRGGSAVRALDVGDLDFFGGTFTAVMGPSGSGKSTLLHCAAGLDRPSDGTVRLAGTDLARLSETALTKQRRARVGFVFQAFNLVSALNVRENILLPSRLAGTRCDRRRLAEIVRRVGLEGRLRHRPAQLSGGEQQRVALARAFVVKPAVLLADEPTGSLDFATGETVMALMFELNREAGTTLVLVTHDHGIAERCDRQLRIEAGRVQE